MRTWESGVKNEFAYGIYERLKVQYSITSILKSKCINGDTPNWHLTVKENINLLLMLNRILICLITPVVYSQLYYIHSQMTIQLTIYK